MYSSIRQLYCCDITYIRRVPPESVELHKINETFEKPYLLIDVYKFAQTFVLGSKIILHSPNLHKCLGKHLLYIVL